MYQDYSNYPEHRYRVFGTKNFKHINPLSNILHVSNISAHIGPSFLIDLFESVAPVEGF